MRATDLQRLLSVLATFGALFALLACSHSLSPAAGTSEPSHQVVATAAPQTPAETELRWVKVPVGNGREMIAAVARPNGSGHFPALIILHGTHGFAEEYVRLAQDMARHGIVGVAACWFAGGSGRGTKFITPIDCSSAPPLTAAATPEARRAVDTLVQATRTFPGVRPDRVALFGHSRGGGAALHYIMSDGTAQAVVLNSAGYPQELNNRVSDIKVPILILHGIGDKPADGGSAMTDVERARSFEAAVRDAGKHVEARYYEGGHNSIFASERQYQAEVEAIVAFLKRHLE